MNQSHRPQRDDIQVIDAHHGRPFMAAIHMLVDHGQVAFVDTGCNDSLPYVLQALREAGLQRDAVKYIVLTHVHLDHAGGAGAMMQAFPSATLVVHPRGVRHMVDPTQLVKGVIAVYGPDYVRAMYGEILPVSSERIIAATDGLTLALGERQLHILDTPGHARHHICVHDEASAGIFTGDTAGLAYPEFDVDGRAFLCPTSTPTQFDPEAMHASLNRLEALSPAVLYMTHYGPLACTAETFVTLRRRIDLFVAVARANAGATDRDAAIEAGLWRAMMEEWRAHGVMHSDEAIRECMAIDMRLNAQGLGFWLDGA